MQDFTSSKLSIDGYFDKVFYINLNRDTVRREHIVRQFQKYGIANYERIEAVQLTEIPDPGQYRNFIKTDARYILGQLSCMASHLKCIRIAKERNYSKVLIFEDDVTFLEDPNKLLAMNSTILNDWDMLYFGGLIEPFFRNQIVCTHAYSLRHTLFDNIINMAVSSGMEIDNFYAKVIQHMSYNYNQSGKYDIRIINPFNRIVQDNSFVSNIQG